MSAEPSARQGHISAAVGDRLYLWGGKTVDFHWEKFAPASALHSFHPLMESWEHCESSGLPPPALFRSVCVSTEGHLYQYGGFNGSTYQDCLYQLDAKSKKWQQLFSSDKLKKRPSGGSPMSKDGCGMVAYGKKLVLFGGYGVPSGATQPRAQFIENTSDAGSGWTNELHIFDLEKGVCLHEFCY